MPGTQTHPTQRSARSLIRSFPIKRFTLASALLIAVAVTGFVSLNRVKGKASQIVADILPGISEAGQANADLAEDFNCTSLMLMAATPAEQARYRDQSVQFATQSKEHLDAYEKAIFSPTDRLNFQHLIAQRRTYLDIRRRVFELMAEGKRPDALDLFRHSLLPAYKSCTTAGQVLLSYNDGMGQLRGDKILIFCSFTQYAVAGCVIALFLLGFIIGIFR